MIHRYKAAYFYYLYWNPTNTSSFEKVAVGISSPLALAHETDTVDFDET
jgi:hypothetical protein